MHIILTQFSVVSFSAHFLKNVSRALSGVLLYKYVYIYN